MAPADFTHRTAQEPECATRSQPGRRLLQTAGSGAQQQTAGSVEQVGGPEDQICLPSGGPYTTVVRICRNLSGHPMTLAGNKKT